MTTNINSQGNQIHPKDDPNIAFHHTFELSLSQKDKQVRIVDDNEVVAKIPLKAFWNSQRCNDQNYYKIHISDMNDSSEEEAWILKNPLLKKTYYERSGKDAVEIIGEIVDEVTNAVGRTITDSRSFTIKEIPELAKNHQVRYAEKMDFKFVQHGNDCKVLTVKGANPSNSDISIDLPSKACVHTDDGKLECSNFGSVREIKKSEGSTKHYMTMTRDKDGHYKYYFSDQDGKKIDDLEFRLSDIRITDPAMLKILQSNYRVNKLHQKSQDIDEKLTQHVDRDADPSPSAVAESLLESKEPELGDAILRAIVSRTDDNADRVLSRLARDTTLQSEVAKDLKGDPAFQGKIKGKDGGAGPRGADGAPGKDADPAEVAAKLFEQPVQLGRAVLDIKDAGQKSELAVELARDSTLRTGVKDLLKSDIEKDVGNLPQMAKSVQGIEEKMEGEERKILEMKQEAISAATESMRHAQRSEDEANRSKTAADASEEHAKRSNDAADESERHAQRSETAASESGVHATNSKTAANKAEEHEINAKDHRENAENLSSSAAEFADNAEESAGCAKILADHAKMLANHAKTSADCAKNPSLQECSSRADYTENPSLQKCLSSASSFRSRREAIWEEPESQYENSESTADFIFG